MILEFLLIRQGAATAAANGPLDNITSLLLKAPSLINSVTILATKMPGEVAVHQVLLGQMGISAARGNQAKTITRMSEIVQARTKAPDPECVQGFPLFTRECVHAQPTTTNDHLVNL
jgi:hypothetical protein